MKKTIIQLTLISLLLTVLGCCQRNAEPIVINERNTTPVIANQWELDEVWAGHPVGFFLRTEGQRQYFSYYNADREMVVGMRMLGEDDWVTYKPQTYFTGPQNIRCRQTRLKPTTRLYWDSHNYMTMALDKDGYVHLSGNMHVNNLTYFRSTKPYDITTLEFIKSMTGELEDRVTYPEFITTPEGELIYGYRHGSSGSGNQIYNIYDTETKTWTRLLEQPLTDGKGERNAYFQGPVLGPDGWHHISWVWRETYDCSTNHDLSYVKSPDLRNWFTVCGKKLELPITIETEGVVVDPVPTQGGIINGTGRIGFDNRDRVVLAYHKFDEQGYTQAYTAKAVRGRWQFNQLTDWEYRWYFEGGGSINFEIRLGEVKPRKDGLMELSYNHIKYGSGTWLLNKDLDIVGKVYKRQQVPSELNRVQSGFPEMEIRRRWDEAGDENDRVRYVMQWETLPRHRDLPREGELPEPSKLMLYEIRHKQTD